MLVAPQSNVRILRAIPWNPDRKHVRLFGGTGVDAKAEQLSYMNGHIAYNLTAFTYVREQNVIRVPVNSENLYNCNYVMYQNRSFGNKWFYAFITSVKYVNTETSEIGFEIDEFNTWFYDTVVPACYVEREHVADDTIGKHTVDEGLGTGELVPEKIFNRFWDDIAVQPPTWGKGFKVIMQLKPTLAGSLLNGDGVEWHENQITPLQKTIEINDASDLATLRNWLKNSSYTGYEVTGSYMYPKEFEDGANDVKVSGNGIKRPTSYSYYYSATALPYTPRNNKLFTYPYTKLVVSTNEGTSKEYRWEYTTTDYIDFRLLMNISNKPQCTLFPKDYMGHSEQVPANSVANVQAISINNFPEVTLTQYESMNAKNVFDNIMSWISLNPAKAIGDSVLDLATDTGNKPNCTIGDNVAFKWRHVGYTFQVMCITGENAKIIDDYLHRFGYKVNEIKVPELFSRKNWNYVKTKEIDLGGNIPADSAKVIAEMFNSGVTLWHINNVGNFDGDNPIVTP